MQELSESLRTKVFRLHEVLSESHIPHAFGGAIAFGFAGVPRSTLDIDLDVFVPVEDAERILGVLEPLSLGFYSGHSRERLRQEGQTRLSWDGTAVDLFFPVHEFYQTVASRVREPSTLSGDSVPVISAEDIVIFKALFNRPKDWIDIESVLSVQNKSFDIAYVLEWLGALLGEDSRIERVHQLFVRDG